MATGLTIVFERLNRAEFNQVVDIARKELYKGTSISILRRWMKSLEDFHGRNQFVQWYIARHKESNKIVGFIRWLAYDFDFVAKKVMLMQSWLAVKREFQRKQIGTQLVEFSLSDICNYWRGKGVEPVMLFVEADETAHGARKFYEAVYGNLNSIVLRDVWEPSEGTIFYFKKIV